MGNVVIEEPIESIKEKIVDQNFNYYIDLIL